MALTVADVLKLRKAGATRVVIPGLIEVEFQAGTLSHPARRVNRAKSAGYAADDAQEPEESRPRRDALAVAQDFNGPIPASGDA